MFVLILAELYRILIYYLREHRGAVALMVEVAIVSTLQDLILRNGHEFSMTRVYGSCRLLVVFAGLLIVERWFSHLRNEMTETSAH